MCVTVAIELVLPCFSAAILKSSLDASRVFENSVTGHKIDLMLENLKCLKPSTHPNGNLLRVSYVDVTVYLFFFWGFLFI